MPINQFGFEEYEDLEPSSPNEGGWLEKTRQAFSNFTQNMKERNKPEQVNPDSMLWDYAKSEQNTDREVQKETQDRYLQQTQQNIGEDPLKFSPPEGEYDGDAFLSSQNISDFSEPSPSGIIETSRQVKGLTEESKQKQKEAELNYTQASNIVNILSAQIGEERARGLENAYNDYIDSTGENFEEFNKGFQRVSQEMDSIADRMEALAQERIDPDRYINNMSKTQKITGALMAFMEGAANAFTERESSFFINKLQKDIQLDIQLQERDILTQRENLKDQTSLLREKLNDHMTLANAKKALEAETLMAVSKKLEAKALADETGLYEERANLAVGEMGKRIAELESDIMSSTFQYLTAEAPRPIDDILDPARVAVVNDEVMLAATKEDAARIKEQVGIKTNIENNLQEIMRLREEHNAFVRKFPKNTSPVASDLRALGVDLKMNLNALAGDGKNLPREMISSLDDWIGNPNAMFPAGFNDRVILKNVGDRFQSLITATNPIPMGISRQQYNEAVRSR